MIIEMIKVCIEMLNIENHALDEFLIKINIELKFS